MKTTKKFILSITLLTLTAFSAQAQPHAIGVRGGSSNFGFGGEISYQHGFGDANRLEIDLGLRNSPKNYNHMLVSVIYQWVWNIEGGFNWYAGLGGQIGSYNHKNGDGDGLTLGAGGQLGIEYDFNDLGAPIQMSIDTRPMFGVLGSNNGFGYGGAFGIRYTF
jgi:hypothetical protein